MARYTICDQCGGIENVDALTPLHLNSNGHVCTFFFHNRRPGDCLDRRIGDMAIIFEAFDQDHVEFAAYMGGDWRACNPQAEFHS